MLSIVLIVPVITLPAELVIRPNAFGHDSFRLAARRVVIDLHFVAGPAVVVSVSVIHLGPIAA
jgi:hypothetical protein